MTVHPNSLANLRPVKPGEVLNKSGVNGYAKLRERTQELIGANLEDLVAVLVKIAMSDKAKDRDRIAAAAKLLAPVLNVQQNELSGPEGGPVQAVCAGISIGDLPPEARQAVLESIQKRAIEAEER